MIQKCQILFCDNEHGTGNVTFPDVNTLDAYSIKQVFIKGNTVPVQTAMALCRELMR